MAAYSDILVGMVVEVAGKYVECETEEGHTFVAELNGLVDDTKPQLLPGELVAAPMEKVVVCDGPLSSRG